MAISVAIKIRVYLKGKMLLLDHRLNYLGKFLNIIKFVAYKKI